MFIIKKLQNRQGQFWLPILHTATHSFQNNMFLLKRIRLLLLMATFVILSSFVYIQPAQGLLCHGCDGKCETGKMSERECNRREIYCSDAEYELMGKKRIIKGCATSIWADNHGYSCEEFKPYHYDTKFQIRLCTCQTDFCNGYLLYGDQETTTAGAGVTSIHRQLLFLFAIVSISVSVRFGAWINW